MALSREQVIDTAVRLLDEVGLEALSLRRVARELGVSAPTLYWHVTDKRALLDHVAERLLADQWLATTPAAGQAWWEWLHERALAQYRALVGHRDAALVLAGNRPTPTSLPAVDAVVGTLVAGGFTAPEAFRAIIIVGNFVIGSAVEYHAERARPSPAPVEPDAGGPDPDAFPHLAAVLDAGHVAGPAGADHEALVAEGLDLLIGGLRARGVVPDPAQPGSPTEVAAASATWSK